MSASRTYVIGDLRTGRRVKTLPGVIEGPWDDTLNDAGGISVKVPLDDPDVRKLDLANNAAPGKSFLAVFDGDIGLQGGPIWAHRLDEDENTLELIGAGMWSYFDHRALLPVLAGRLPTDPTTDTRWQNISTDPDNPWPTNTSKSYQGMFRGMVEQAQAETGGNVPVILPAEIPGDRDRWFKGSDVGTVGGRMFDLTQLENGPDAHFDLRKTSDKLGVEWPLRLGTPTEPLLSGARRAKFYMSVPDRSVSNLKVYVDGTAIANRGIALGGRSIDQALVTVSTDPTLLDAGYPFLDAIDASHTSVSETATLQQYSDALVTRGRRPAVTVSFDHDLRQAPAITSLNVGDFVTLVFKEHPYFGTQRLSFRIVRRSGDADPTKLSLTFYPETI